MNTDNHTFSNTYMSSIATSRDVANDLKRFWLGWDIQGNTIDELELCVVELVNNAYEHAYNEAEGKPIEIVSRCQNSKSLLILPILVKVCRKMNSLRRLKLTLLSLMQMTRYMDDVWKRVHYFSSTG
ncbi:serine-protein kinase RsbW [Vibrio variabilis]|uniref:Serine-protein kinase RsbW n=1 Tax=Vibrio variabilis TaxID=990271 RepID=A0ABQ0JLN5_9VIBR|nr:serine-protein kinase RsbW [Vibrio variabilis]